MKISIVIPVINEADLIVDAVRRAWHAGADEVIVVDGGSTDQTHDRAANLECKLLTSQPSRSLQMDHGVTQATGDVLLFLHADNWLAADACQQIRECPNDNHQLWGGFRQQIEHPSRPYRWLEFGNSLRVRWQSLVYGDQAMFIDRNLYRSVGGFPNQPLMEDFEISRQLSKRSRAKLLTGPVHVSARRWLRNGIVRQSLNNWSVALAYRLGRSPEKLQRYYRRHDSD